MRMVDLIMKTRHGEPLSKNEIEAIVSGFTSGKIPEVELTKSAAKKKAKTVVIPKTVKVDGVNYKVTAIAEKAFAGIRIVCSK